MAPSHPMEIYPTMNVSSRQTIGNAMVKLRCIALHLHHRHSWQLTQREQFTYRHRRRALPVDVNGLHHGDLVTPEAGLLQGLGGRAMKAERRSAA